MSETLNSASQSTARRPWWKRLLRFFFWLCGGFVFLLVLAVVLTFVFEDKIKGFVLGKVNQYLNTTIYVDTEKDVRLTVIRTFPQVSVEFNNISALDATSNAKRDTLFQAKRIDLRFNILDFFKSNYTIRHIAVDQAVLDLRTDLKGNDNYHFLKTDTSASNAANTDVAFALEKFEFNDVKLRWRDKRDKSDYEITITTSELAGDFGSKNYTLVSKADFVVGKLKQGKAEWFAGNSGSFQVDLNVDNTTNQYRINKCKAQLSDLKLNVTGNITDSDRGYLMNLAVKGDEVAIRDALSLLPVSYAKDIEGISSTGDFFVDATINGLYNDSLMPDVEAKFGVYKGATLTRAGTPVKLENIVVDGTFSTAKENSGLHISTFQAQTRTSKFSGTFDLTNLERPSIRAKMDGHIDLGELIHLLQPDTIQEASGTLDVHLETAGKPGKAGTFTAANLREFQTSGEVRLLQSRVKLKNALLPIDSINGLFIFDGNNVAMRGMHARSGTSDFTVNGTLRNLLGWVLVDKTELDVEADFRSNNIDFNSLLGTSSTTAGDTTYKLVFPERVQLRLHTRVNRLAFRQFEAADLSGDLVLRNRRLVADPIHIRTMGGEIDGTGMIDGTSIDSLLITGNAKL
ncbi:MAG: AsmA family protein, partial [Bacteroidia bacterium]